MKKNAVFILFERFEELEAIAPLDILRRAGVNVLTASATNKLCVCGRSSIQVNADLLLDELSDTPPDALVIPGGPGVFDISADGRIKDLILKCQKNGSLICAICAAPTLLLGAGAMENAKVATSHFSVKDKFGDIWTDSPVVRDGNIITSQGAGTAVEFGLAIAEALCGKNTAFDVANAICFNKFQPLC